MSETEILQFIRRIYGEMIAQSAAEHRHRPEVLAGIIMRETHGGLSPLLDCKGPEGRGDRDKEGRYHGHGLCQIDDRSFPEFCAGPDWKDAAKNIDKGAWVLGRKRALLAARTLGFRLTIDARERATIAAYNCGEGTVLKLILAGKDIDARTSQGNYSREVLRFAEIYSQLQKEVQ